MNQKTKMDQVLESPNAVQMSYLKLFGKKATIVFPH